MNDNEQLIADLQATRDRMTEETWSSYGWYNAAGRLCIQGHLLEAVTGKQFWETYPLFEQMGRPAKWRYEAGRKALAENVPSGRTLGGYNDSGITFADIQAVLDKTLANLGGLG